MSDTSRFPPLHPFPLTSCHAPRQYSQLSQTRSGQTAFMKSVSGHAVWPCVMGMRYKGRQRGGEDTRDPSELLRVIIWWLMVGGCQVQHDKLCQARITLSRFCAVYLSAFLCLTTPSLPYTHPSTSSVLAFVTSQTNFWGGMSSKVLDRSSMHDGWRVHFRFFSHASRLVSGSRQSISILDF